RGAEAREFLLNGDGGAEPGAPASDDQHIVLGDGHVKRSRMYHAAPAACNHFPERGLPREPPGVTEVPAGVGVAAFLTSTIPRPRSWTARRKVCTRGSGERSSSSSTVVWLSILERMNACSGETIPVGA